MFGLTRDFRWSGDEVDAENTTQKRADSKQNEKEPSEANLMSTKEAMGRHSAVHDIGQQDSVGGLVVQDCLTEIHSLRQKLKEYLAIEQELSVVKEKLNRYERKEKQHSWKLYSELLIDMSRKQNEWRQIEFELQMKLRNAEARTVDITSQMEESKEQLHFLNMEKQKNQHEVMVLESELLRANQKIELLLEQAEINQVQQRSEVVRLQRQLEQLTAEREELMRRRESQLEEFRREKVSRELLLREYEGRNQQLEEQLKRAPDDARKRFETERIEMKAKLDGLERNLQNDAIAHERKMNMLLLEANHLRWERDKALEQVTTCRIKCSGSQFALSHL